MLLPKPCLLPFLSYSILSSQENLRKQPPAISFSCRTTSFVQEHHHFINNFIQVCYCRSTTVNLFGTKIYVLCIMSKLPELWLLKEYFYKGGFFLDFVVLYSTLFHLPPLRLHCAGGCWDRTQGWCYDFGGIGTVVRRSSTPPLLSNFT